MKQVRLWIAKKLASAEAERPREITIYVAGVTKPESLKVASRMRSYLRNYKLLNHKDINWIQWGERIV
jgi:hypothetical protein